MQSVFDDYHAAIDALIDVQKRLMDEIGYREADQKNAYSKAFYAINFCSVTCDIGRQTGKTEYIKKRLKAGKSIVVVKDEKSATNSRNAGTLGGLVLTVHDVFSRHRHKKLKYGTVFFDDASLFLNDENFKYRLYDYLAKDHDTIFVLLG